MDREPLSEPLKPAIYVVDTHIVVWFAEGLYTNLSWAATGTLLDPRTRIVIPSYVLQEIRNKFPYLNTRKNNQIAISPTALLRLLHRCSNARILPRGEAILAKEFALELMRSKRQIDVEAQDIPVAAAVLVAKEYYGGPTTLITSDEKLEKWALSVGIPVLQRRPPFGVRRARGGV